MKIVGDVNRLSEKAKPLKLKPGQSVVYRLLCGVPNPDNEQRAKIPVLYPQSVTIPSKDRIVDQGTGEYVDIAIVETYDKDKNIRPLKLAIRAKENNGHFSCNGGNIREEEIYEYCEITNYNKSNPNRDQSVTPLFERVDPLGDSKQRNKKRSTLLEALKYADAMTAGDVKKFAASVNWDESLPLDILKDKIGEWIEKDPSSFVRAVEDKGRDIKAVIKEAISAGKLSYDSVQHRIVLGASGQTLIKLERVEGADYLAQAADWIATHKNGEKTLATIEKLTSPTS